MFKSTRFQDEFYYAPCRNRSLSRKRNRWVAKNMPHPKLIVATVGMTNDGIIHSFIILSTIDDTLPHAPLPFRQDWAGNIMPSSPLLGAATTIGGTTVNNVPRRQDDGHHHI